MERKYKGVSFIFTFGHPFLGIGETLKEKVIIARLYSVYE